MTLTKLLLIVISLILSGVGIFVLIWHVCRMVRPINMYKTYRKVYVKGESIYD